MSTVRPEEVERFNRLAATWWNRTGPMRPLHVVNELRLGHVFEQIAQRFGRPVGALHGLRIADIGCGAGLMCEPLAARGAQIVGVDAAANNIAAARLHGDASVVWADHRHRVNHVQVAGFPARNEPGGGGFSLPDLCDDIDATCPEVWVAAEYRPAKGTAQGLGWLTPYRGKK